MRLHRAGVKPAENMRSIHSPPAALLYKGGVEEPKHQDSHMPIRSRLDTTLALAHRGLRAASLSSHDREAARSALASNVGDY